MGSKSSRVTKSGNEINNDTVLADEVELAAKRARESQSPVPTKAETGAGEYDHEDEEFLRILRQLSDESNKESPVVISPSAPTNPVIITQSATAEPSKVTPDETATPENQSRDVGNLSQDEGGVDFEAVADDSTLDVGSSSQDVAKSERDLGNNSGVENSTDFSNSLTAASTENKDLSAYEEITNIIQNKAKVSCTVYDGNDANNVKEVAYDLATPDSLPEGSIVLIGDAAREFNEIMQANPSQDPYTVALSINKNNAKQSFQPTAAEFQSILTHVKCSEIKTKLGEQKVKLAPNKDEEKFISELSTETGDVSNLSPKDSIFYNYFENFSNLLAEKNPLETTYAELQGHCQEFQAEIQQSRYAPGRVASTTTKDVMPKKDSPQEKSFNRDPSS